MSIVPLNKVTLCGLSGDQEKVLEGLQRLGCLHLIPLQPPAQESEAELFVRDEEAHEALLYLMDVRRRRHQVLKHVDFDFDHVLAAALANKQNRREAEDRRYFLVNRIRDLEPWGDFTLPDLDQLGGYRLWFYRVPYAKMKSLQDLEWPWQQVSADHRFTYVVVIAKQEPPANALPVARTYTGAVSLTDLKHELQRVEIQLEDLDAEHEALSRWIHLFSKNLARADDRAAIQYAGTQTRKEVGIFMVQGWMPARELEQLEAFAEQQELALLVEPARPDDAPPTLMDNPPELSSGQDLVSFYQTPGYRTWDPSIAVFFSFAVFFAMILSDAGYALVLAVIVACYWPSMGSSAGGRHFRILSVMGLIAAIIYGVLVGSYFGAGPEQIPRIGSWLTRFQVLNINNYDAMMQLAIAIGCLHITFANIIAAIGAGGFAGKAKPLGWIVVIAGGLTLSLGLGEAAGHHLGIGLLVGGFLVIFLGGFLGSRQKNLPLRLVAGLGSLTQISKLFGDIMSYLRLFALGLASASLALTFNQLAHQVYQSVPGLGLLLSILILLLGHGINLALGIISGFVHGLRLNFIEFFNWGITDEGYPFQAFAKKESNP
ncbi:v-type atpase 116 kda subunit [Leptolyngbya sp. Heron Island J]|uniref:V-type ATP synthase subunit I n=1 Tax=Leptolyngbya sp. Heron Island J TaxID=1385935 RepID=UPI0003B9DF03|nr:V-type ATPase [Leptolyngbya sp. Heron Island J]ESA33644.1 v-type atpase 116 kda subunit [Leptolyngbya sp. Heron Island J]